MDDHKKRWLTADGILGAREVAHPEQRAPEVPDDWPDVAAEDAGGTPFNGVTSLSDVDRRKIASDALQWQGDLANEIGGLVRVPGYLDRWRQVMREWAADENPPGAPGRVGVYELYEPLLFEGVIHPLSLRAKYVLLAAVHDGILIGLEQMQPWGTPTTPGAATASCPDLPHRLRYEEVIRGLPIQLADKEGQLLDFLADVKQDFTTTAAVATPSRSVRSILLRSARWVILCVCVWRLGAGDNLWQKAANSWPILDAVFGKNGWWHGSKT